MARRSSTGRTFLVLRPDSGQYIYHRTLPSEVAPYVVGLLDMRWAPEARSLCGKPTIKISLKTGDLGLAQYRWGILHPQIESLVRQANLHLRSQSRQAGAGTSRLVNGLAPEAIAILARQVHHDILAEDDRGWTDPESLSPTASIIAGLWETAGLAMKPQDARMAAQHVAKAFAEGALKNRALDLIDLKMSEGEPEGIDPDFMERLGLAEEGDRLSEEEHKLFNRKPRQSYPILSDVGEALAANGIDLPANHPDRRALTLAIARSQVEAYRAVEARRQGATQPTPPRPANIMMPESERATPTLGEIRERWILLKQPGDRAVADNRLYIGRFIDLHGDLPITKITKKMVRDFRDTLIHCPRNVPKTIASQSLQARIAWAEKQEEEEKKKTKKSKKVPRLSRRTINTKGLGSLSALMAVACEDDLIPSNLCEKQLLPLPRRKINRLPYSLGDLIKIFASPVYATGERWVAGAGEASFWIPLIALFSGARLEEIGQLLLTDIIIEDGITCFHFIDLSPDDDNREDDGDDEDLENEEDETLHPKKKVKTENARRKVPVHPLLIRCGFLRYLESLHAQKAPRLFPLLKPYKDQLTHNWSKWWGRYSDEFVTRDPLKVFHSLRHCFADRLRNQRVEGGAIKALMGHATEMYGQSVGLETRAEIIAKLDYPGLDLSHLYTEQN